jgi:hypothetical protein
MIALARQRHPQVQFYTADISTWSFAKKYDFISAWDSTWHLPIRGRTGPFAYVDAPPQPRRGRGKARSTASPYLDANGQRPDSLMPY